MFPGRIGDISDRIQKGRGSELILYMCSTLKFLSRIMYVHFVHFVHFVSPCVWKLSILLSFSSSILILTTQYWFLCRIFRVPIFADLDVPVPN
jgi:hypothetical protein